MPQKPWIQFRGNPSDEVARPSTAASFSKYVGLGRNRRPDINALRLLRVFDDSSFRWLWATDARGMVTYLSKGITKALNLSPDNLSDHSLVDLFTHADPDSTGRTTLPFALAKHVPFDRLVIISTEQGREDCWSLTGRPQFDDNARFIGFCGSAVDITEHRIFTKKAAELAKYDSLTGLPNRLRLSEVVQEASSTRGSCALILIDLDRFKQVNDTLGHPAGDELLRQVSDRLMRLVGDREKVFRLGGDEFAIVLPQCQDRSEIGDLCKGAIEGLSAPYSIEGSRCVIGASVGIAIGPTDGGSRDELIRNADLALYASKADGRGRFRFFSSDLLVAAEDRRTLEDDLRDALAAGHLQLAYQPIMNATTNAMTGVEALLRWHHPTRGSISPEVFVPIAEETGLINSIGEWVLHQACRDAASWPGFIRVAVNVSPIQFNADALPEVVLSALAHSGLAPDRLELEITEGVFLGDTSKTEEVFSTLKKIGVRLALDDFGTGYSSLGYLQNAPFDKIKIDQTFVRAATLPGSRNSAIIAAIVALADALDMETTAEGIEYMDQLRLIRNLRVSHAQGWVYSKAISSDELTERLNAGTWTIEPSGPANQRSDRQAVYLKVGVVYRFRYHEVMLRNLSESGALIEGAVPLTVGALILVDFGDGQLTFATVRRTSGEQHGVKFLQTLAADGAGGLCTSRRVSRHLLSTYGLPSATNPTCPEDDALLSEGLAKLAEHLGVDLSPQNKGSPPEPSCEYFTPAERLIPTFRQLSSQYLSKLEDNGDLSGTAERDLRNHVLPRFGQLRLDQVSQADIFTWLAAKAEVENQPPGTDRRLHRLLNEMWSLAIHMEIPGADPNPLEGHVWADWLSGADASLTFDEATGLVASAHASVNRSLKFVIALMILGRVRLGDVLTAEWADLDQEQGVWKLAQSRSGQARNVVLTAPAIQLIEALPRYAECPYLLPNPITMKPFKSILGSWHVVRRRAGLFDLEIDDLRFSDIRLPGRQAELVDLVLNGSPRATLADTQPAPEPPAYACDGSEADLLTPMA